jgi:hypothetical protein
MSEVRCLSAADVAACEVTPAAMNAAVEAVFAAMAAGAARSRPALSIPADGPSSFRAKGGVVNAEGFSEPDTEGRPGPGLRAGLRTDAGAATGVLHAASCCWATIDGAPT